MLQRIRPIFLSGDTWRWGWQILFYLPIVSIGTALMVGPLFWLAMQANWLPAPMGTAAGWPSILALVVFRYLFLFAAVLASTHLAQRWLRRSSLADLGLHLRPGWWRDLLLGCGLGALLIVISIALSWLMGWYQVTGVAWQFRSPPEVWPALVRSILPNFQAGLLEEVVFRGYLFQVLEKRWNTWVAALASSFLFALSHLTNPEQDYPTWMVLFSLTLAGLLFVQAYLVRRSLWLPIGIHFAYDWLIGLLGQVGQAPQEAVFLVTQVSGPALLQGPRFAGMGFFDLIGAAEVALILWRLGSANANR